MSRGDYKKKTVAFDLITEVVYPSIKVACREQGLNYTTERYRQQTDKRRFVLMDRVGYERLLSDAYYYNLVMKAQ